jgi:hypothetical protein
MLATLAVAAPVVAGCGVEEELEVKEGEPLELGQVSYNVQLTRFLNANDVEDGGYLVGQPDAPEGKEYLGVFMRIENEGDEPARVPANLEVKDTQDKKYEPIPSESPYALELGSSIAPDSSVPRPDTTAAAGPTQGAMVLFLVDDDATENRPLELAIPGEDETGIVELDI